MTPFNRSGIPSLRPSSGDRLSVTIAAGRTHLSMVRRGRVVWSGEAVYDQAGGTMVAVQALVELLTAPKVDGRPLRRWRASTRQLHLALGAPFVRVKTLHGLPNPCEPALLHDLVAADPRRFFVLPATTPVRTVVHRDASGTIWGAAYDGTMLRALHAGCASVGARVRYIAPLQPLMVIDRIGTHEASEMAPELAGEGADVPRAMATHPLAITPNMAERGGARQGRRRLLAVSVAAMLVLVSATFLPGLTMARQAARDQAELRHLAPELTRAIAADQELARVTQRLQAVSEFAADRRSMAEVLAHLSIALPEDVTVLSLRLDAGAGTLSLVGHDVTGAAAALERSPIVAAAEVVGAVHRDVPALSPAQSPASDDEVEPAARPVRERATIRIRLRAATQGPRSSLIGRASSVEVHR